MTKKAELAPCKSWKVGECPHGFRAYCLTSTDPATAEWARGLWHSGPPTGSRRRGPDRADTADGIRLARCEGRDRVAEVAASITP